jgi:hypothetical protein
MARAAGGRKDSRAATLLHPTLKEANPVRLEWPLKNSTPVCSNSLNRKSNTPLVCSNSLNRKSNTPLVCSNSLNRRSNTPLVCSNSLNRKSNTSSKNRNRKVTLKRKKNSKITNNSNGWNPVDLIPVRICRSLKGSVLNVWGWMDCDHAIPFSYPVKRAYRT